MIGKLINIKVVLFTSLILFSQALPSQQNPILQIEKGSQNHHLRPILIDCNTDNESVPDTLCKLLNAQIANEKISEGKKSMYKFTLFSKDSIFNLRFTSKLCNYATDLNLFYKTDDNTFEQQIYLHNGKDQYRESWIGEAILPLPAFKGKLDFYIISNYRSWVVNEWYIYSEDMYQKHVKLMSVQMIIYLSLVFLFLLFALICLTVFKKKDFAYYAFYLFATSLYIFKELNVLPLQVFYDSPRVLHFLYESVYGIFILAFLLYTRRICYSSQINRYKTIFYKLLVGLTIFHILFITFVLNSMVGLWISYITTYGAVLYFIIECISNFNKSFTLRCFLGAILIIVIVSSLVDLQLGGILEMPSIYYWIIPAFILEFILIGIGLIYHVNQDTKELSSIKEFNLSLNKNVTDLKRKINHSQQVYQKLMVNGTQDNLNLPPEYLDDPLTQREIEVIQLLDKGYTNQELAAKMFISRNTVKTHLKNIYKKLDVNDRNAALEKIRSFGLI